jgi:hypothetical protein
VDGTAVLDDGRAVRMTGRVNVAARRRESDNQASLGVREMSRTVDGGVLTLAVRGRRAGGRRKEEKAAVG